MTIRLRPDTGLQLDAAEVRADDVAQDGEPAGRDVGRRDVHVATERRRPRGGRIDVGDRED
jgi:hypothetical protein